MLHYVATVRPDLSPEERLLQLESLIRFRTQQYNRIEPGFDESWKRGILFESLVLSDPRFPELSEAEQQIGRYLLCALEHDIFQLTSFGRMHYPDDIVVSVQGETATVIGLVEVKLNLVKRQGEIREQLGAHANNLRKLELWINQYLSEGNEPPVCEDVVWPSSVRSLVVPADCDRVLFKPANSSFVTFSGWQVIPALFTREEVRVVSDFLWHVGQKGGKA